jgi:hypothetical protein
MRALTSRDLRALGVGAAILVPALLYVWGVQPFLASLADTRATLAVERTALAKERALLAAAPRGARVRRSVDSLVASQTDRLFDATDDAIAASQLSTYVAELARANHVLVQEAQAQTPGVSPAGVRSFPVAIRAESDFEGIMDLLQALESGRKIVRIDALTLSAPSGADAAASPGVVRLRATVVGFGVTPARAPSAAAARIAAR